MEKRRQDGDPIEVVRGVVRAAWSGEGESWISRYAADDFVWIGAAEEQRCLDRAQTLAVYKRIAETIPDMVISDESYQEVVRAGDLCVVVGTCTMLSDPRQMMAFGGRQRSTAVLRRTPEGYRIVHLHTSHPIAKAKTGTAEAPVGISEAMFDYVRLLTRQYDDRETIDLKDTEGTVHVVRPFEITFLKADRQRTEVHIVGDSFTVRRGIGSLAAQLPDGLFCEVRRGVVVNVIHIARLDGSAVVLVGGERFPLPERRGREVARRIEGMRARVVTVCDKFAPGPILSA